MKRKLKVKPDEAEMIRDALAARVTVWETLARHPRNHAARDMAASTRALLKRLFIKEIV